MIKQTILASLLLGAAGTASASPMITADPARIAGVLMEEGYRAEMDTDSQGDPLIRSASSGVNYSIYFYGCTNGFNCSEIQFSAGFDLDPGAIGLRDINMWNSEKRFGQAFLDDEGDPYVQFDVNLGDGGVAEANFVDTLDFWNTVLGQFTTHINW